MGGIPGDVPGGAGRGPGQLGADGAAVGVPQESPRSEETDARENQWGEDQACCDGENIKSPRKVCKLTRLEGCVDDPNSVTGTSNDPNALDRSRGNVLRVTSPALPAGQFAGLNIQEPENFG